MARGKKKKKKKDSAAAAAAPVLPSARRLLPSARALAPISPPPPANGSFRALRESLGVTQQQMQRLTGISVRKLSALETGAQRPAPEDLRRWRELARLREALGPTLPPEQLGLWLATPDGAFAGLSPLEVIERGEADRLWLRIWQNGT